MEPVAGDRRLHDELVFVDEACSDERPRQRHATDIELSTGRLLEVADRVDHIAGDERSAVTSGMLCASAAATNTASCAVRLSRNSQTQRRLQARHAARAAAAASAAAYLHPLAQPTQVGHILGAAAEAARAAELARGDDPVVAEYVLDAAAKRMPGEVRAVLDRYPRITPGSTRVSALMARLDSLLRDPPPPKRAVDDEGPFFHGTRADVVVGALPTPGWQSNYGSRRESNNIHRTASEWGAPLAAELAHGEGPPRVYRVEPLGDIEDDPARPSWRVAWRHGQRILNVVTNVGEYPGTGEPTGLWLSELTHAWDVFDEHGFEQTIVSPQGGLSPLEPKSLKFPTYDNDPRPGSAACWRTCRRGARSGRLPWSPAQRCPWRCRGSHRRDDR